MTSEDNTTSNLIFLQRAGAEAIFFSSHADAHYLENGGGGGGQQVVPGGSSLEQLNCIVANIPLESGSSNNTVSYLKNTTASETFFSLSPMT